MKHTTQQTKISRRTLGGRNAFLYATESYGLVTMLKERWRGEDSGGVVYGGSADSDVDDRTRRLDVGEVAMGAMLMVV